MVWHNYVIKEIVGEEERGVENHSKSGRMQLSKRNSHPKCDKIVSSLLAELNNLKLTHFFHSLILLYQLYAFCLSNYTIREALSLLQGEERVKFLILNES